MRVLLLAHVFPPHPEVGALRAAGLLAAFRDAGHQVTLVTEPLPGEVPRIPPGSGPDVRVISVEPGLPYTARLGRALQRLRLIRAAPPGGAGARVAPDSAPGPGPLRRLLRAVLGIPDDANYCIAPFARAGQAALREGADLIYSSAPPFSLHLSARRLRRRSGIPWVAEFRDPWVHPGSTRPPARHPLTSGIDRFLERRVLASADAIVMATESAKEHVAHRLPASERGRVLVARNGIPDWGEPPPLPGGSTPFRIVHTGTLYQDRNPAGFFAALAQYVRHSGITPSRLQIEMIGRQYQGTSVTALVERMGVREFVQFEDWLPHEQVRERLFRANALLLFAQGQPLQVPNKLYEYLAVRRPILAFVDQHGESTRILERFPESRLFFGAEPEPVVAVLRELLERPLTGRPAPAPTAMESLSTRVQLGALVAELERRFGKAQRSHSARA